MGPSLDGLAEAKPSSREQELEAQVTALRAKLAKKEHVIAELSEELIEAKPFGAPDPPLGAP